MPERQIPVSDSSRPAAATGPSGARDPEPSEAEPPTTVVAGIDVGGTTIKARAVRVVRPAPEQDGRPAAESEVRSADPAARRAEAGVRATPLDPAIRRPTPVGDPEAALEQIAATVRALAERHESEPLGGIGVVVPGIIDEENGIAVFQAQLGWDRLPVVARLGELTGLPVALGHDVRGGGLAEWRLGAGKGTDNLLFVMLGTGIGSAVVVDGRLLTADGYAGQLGHTEVRAAPGSDAECGCGQRGCLGRMASAQAVVQRYAERSGNREVTEARDVAARARSGDPAAIEVWDEAVTALAAGLADAVTLFGSERVVLGGGLALAGEQLSGPVTEALRRRLTFHRRPTIRTAQLGDESAILGAALLAARRTT